MTTAPAIIGSSSWSLLTLNAGSSSLKFALFGGGATPVRVLSGAFDRVGLSEARFALRKTDTLVFAGGIGENASLIRVRICEGLGFLGIELDESRNTENASLISTDAGRVAVRVIRTDEELMIARSVVRVPGLGAQKES